MSGQEFDRRRPRDWGSYGDASTASMLLTGLAGGDADRMLVLIDQQERLDRVKAGLVTSGESSAD